MTFATIDWVMSITPGWPSTMFPLIVIVGQGLLGMSLAIIMGRGAGAVRADERVDGRSSFLGQRQIAAGLRDVVGLPELLQWLIIWAGNLPEEIH